VAAKFVVTLVHGTWADTRGWVAPGSFLRRELDRRLDHLTFRAFAWSGRNTHAARTEAGASLAQFIRDGHVRYPDAHHFVVAHSHGGNVALYAMRDPAARDAVTGIVTLGTPFIYTRCRDVARHAHVFSWLMLGVAALIHLARFCGFPDGGSGASITPMAH
jgi:alpha-beta hydrolase superfamily lysophospholipase